MNLALFDFDGTITKKDSLLDFTEYAVGKKSIYKSLPILLPVLTRLKLGVVPNDRAKELFLSHFFKGWDADEFVDVAQKYSCNQLQRIVKESAVQTLNHHKKQGDKVVIVSASIDLWLYGWCDLMSVELIASRMQIENGKITGRLDGKNCHGQEKARRVKQAFNLESFSHIFAYGDTAGDKQMLSLAHHGFYRKFS